MARRAALALASLLAAPGPLAGCALAAAPSPWPAPMPVVDDDLGQDPDGFAPSAGQEDDLPGLAPPDGWQGGDEQPALEA